MISESQIILRLLIAAALGLVVGYERERQDHAAGLRTHMILITGSALAMAISINLAFLLGTNKPVGDPARLAAQVVSGIGFLGGGVIFRYGINVRGLTTAASLWTVTMVGLAVGAGFYWAAAAATVILIGILTLLNYIEDRMLPSYNRVHVILRANYRPEIVKEVKELLQQRKRRIGNMGIDRDKEEEKISLDLQVRLWKDDPVEEFVEELTRIQGITQVKITE